jgi:hypothetical protein
VGAAAAAESTVGAAAAAESTVGAAAAAESTVGAAAAAVSLSSLVVFLARNLLILMRRDCRFALQIYRNDRCSQ